MPEFAVGDSNGDGKIDIKDATTIQKCIAKITALTPQQQKAADANCDGKVDINDATLIQKYLAKSVAQYFCNLSLVFKKYIVIEMTATEITTAAQMIITIRMFE